MIMLLQENTRLLSSSRRLTTQSRTPGGGLKVNEFFMRRFLYALGDLAGVLRLKLVSGQA